MQQVEVALLDEVSQRHATTGVAPSHHEDKTQVGLDETAAGEKVALRGALREQLLLL